MKLRSSSHRLNCETGRYITNDELTKRHHTPSWLKRCEFSTAKDVLYRTHLPFSNIIDEDEQHVLITRFHEYRLNVQEPMKSLLLRNEDHHELFKWEHVQHLGRYVRRIFRTRFKKRTSSPKLERTVGIFEFSSYMQLKKSRFAVFRSSKVERSERESRVVYRNMPCIYV